MNFVRSDIAIIVCEQDWNKSKFSDDENASLPATKWHAKPLVQRTSCRKSRNFARRPGRSSNDGKPQQKPKFQRSQPTARETSKNASLTQETSFHAARTAVWGSADLGVANGGVAGPPRASNKPQNVNFVAGAPKFGETIPKRFIWQSMTRNLARYPNNSARPSAIRKSRPAGHRNPHFIDRKVRFRAGKQRSSTKL